VELNDLLLQINHNWIINSGFACYWQ